MRVLVTGASGLVGRYIVHELLEAGHEVVAAGRTPPDPLCFKRQIPFLPFSLDIAPEQQSYIGIDALVHAAFDHLPGRYRGGEGEDPAGFRRRNLDGTLHLFEAAARAGTARAIFLSSRAVYGDPPPGTQLDEESATQPTTLYGEVKLAAEEAIAALGHAGFHPSILRATGVYGGLFPNKWEGMIRDYLAGRKGAARAGSEVHGSDIGKAIGLILAADAPSMRGRVFNISDIVVDSRQILAPLAARLRDPPPLPEPAETTKLAVMRCEALFELGWRPGGMPLFEKTMAEIAERVIPNPLFTSRETRLYSPGND